MSKILMRKIEALQIAIKDYSDSMLYICTICPADQIRRYLQARKMNYGLCYYFEQHGHKGLFDNEELPKSQALWPMPCTARFELYFHPSEYRDEVIRLLSIRHEYIIRLRSKYLIESHGLQRISVPAN